MSASCIYLVTYVLTVDSTYYSVEVGGRQDFNNTPIQVIFPATMNDSRVEQNITIPIIDDVITEFTEGFFLHATIDQGQSNPIDVQGASPVMSGVTLISINDNDGELPFT